jgi:hypothetical protein
VLFFYIFTEILLDTLRLWVRIVFDIVEGKQVTGYMRNLSTLIWRATSGGTARKDLFVCPTGMEYIDRRFEAGKSAGVAGDRERMA